MKKHIFGFVLFGLIVASFALVYAFFNAPSIPPVEAVTPPVAQTETREEKPYYCDLRRNKLSYEVLSSQYFVEENRIVSQIRITFNGSIRTAPSKIYVNTTFSSVGNIGKDGFGDSQIVENPFSDSREKVVTITSRVTNEEKIKPNENLYILALVTDYDSSRNYKNSEDITQAKAVLFVYGKNSVTNDVKMRGKLSSQQ
ncbi:MAG TPA: hypothetical protein VNB22_03370 [Pyrinomonadaceae bacterium]|nr:hypothetical protein [Pyrinomonadaceae bacterium]